MAIKTMKISNWLASNGQAITNASKDTMKSEMLSSLKEIHDNVFIVTHSKTSSIPSAFTPDAWTALQNAGEVADGVLLVTGGHTILIAPTEATGLKWSSKPVSSDNLTGAELIDGVTTSNDRNTVLKDWDGRANTTAIIKGSTSTNITSTSEYGAGFCNNYSRVNSNGNGVKAGNWWMPSLSELEMIWANFEKVNYALGMINGATLLSRSIYWSSTQGSSNTAWIFGFSNGYFSSTWKFSEQRVRPVSDFSQ